MLACEEAIDVILEAGVIARLQPFGQRKRLRVHEATSQITTRVESETAAASAERV